MMNTTVFKQTDHRNSAGYGQLLQEICADGLHVIQTSHWESWVGKSRSHRISRFCDGSCKPLVIELNDAEKHKIRVDGVKLSIHYVLGASLRGGLELRWEACGEVLRSIDFIVDHDPHNLVIQVNACEKNMPRGGPRDEELGPDTSEHWQPKEEVPVLTMPFNDFAARMSEGGNVLEWNAIAPNQPIVQMRFTGINTPALLEPQPVQG